MKRECKQKNGDYQIWSGTDSTANFKKLGTYIVYWKGVEIKRCRYMEEAQHCIFGHKQLLSTAPRPKRRDMEVTPDTEAWLDQLL